MPTKDKNKQRLYARAHYYNNKDVMKRRAQEYKEFARARNKQFSDDLKKRLSCLDCGNSDYRVLHFHHVEKKDKIVSVLVASGCSIARIQAEIDKCVPLCANCRIIRHYKEDTKAAPVNGAQNHCSLDGGKTI